MRVADRITASKREARGERDWFGSSCCALAESISGTGPGCPPSSMAIRPSPPTKAGPPSSAIDTHPAPALWRVEFVSAVVGALGLIAAYVARPDAFVG